MCKKRKNRQAKICELICVFRASLDICLHSIWDDNITLLISLNHKAKLTQTSALLANVLKH